MTEAFELLQTTRDNLLKATAALTVDQWNKIPDGFNNNIFWNFAHILVTQQLLCYKLAGAEALISDQLIAANRKGTRPGEAVNKESIDEVRALMLSTGEQLQKDYLSGKLSDFNPYSTSYNYTLNSIEQAINFNNVHEAMHYGTILAMKKLV